MVDIPTFFTGLLNAEDPIGYLADAVSRLIQDIQSFVLGLIPSGDDIADMASGLVSGAASFLGFGESDEEKEDRLRKELEQKMARGMSRDAAMAEIRDQESGIDTSSEEYQNVRADRQRRLDQQREAREVGVVETTGTDADGTQFVERKRIETGESRYAGMNRFERKVARQERREEQLRAIGERQAQRAGNDRGTELDSMSRENAQKGGANNVTIAAPTQSNVTNNNSNTSAIIDQNLPTVDHNDRSWSYA